MSEGIWITWESQRRNKGISSALSWILFEILSNKQRLLRYAKSILLTVKILNKKKPKYVAVQNPSIVLATLAIILKTIFKYITIIDAHNSGIFPKEGRSRILMAFSRWIQRSADLTIVTTKALKKIVESNGGKGFVLPDRIPINAQKTSIVLPGKFNIACISSFGEDEPYRSIINAGYLISNDIYIYMTGKYQGKVNAQKVPPNVKMLGYVTETKFWTILNSVDAIIDLTNRENCLVCGAYEGVAVGKPLILSNTKAIEEYFNKGCIYVSSSPYSIAEGIESLVKEKDRLKGEIVKLRIMLKKEWEEQFKKLIKVLKYL